MKTYNRMFLILLLIITFASCASTDSGSVYKEKKQSHEKLLFDDWKYKGFGQQLPQWFEAAYKGDVEAIRKKVRDLADKDIKIVTAQGINSDQADKSLRLKLQEFSDYKTYDLCWALLGEKAAESGNYEYPYFAAAVLYE